MAQAELSIPSSLRLTKLLHPLPIGAEPVVTLKYQRALIRAAGERWRRTMRHVWAAEYDYRRAGMKRAIADDEGSPAEIALAEAEERVAFLRLLAQIDRQMQVPALSGEAVRWKQKSCGIDGGRAEWDAAIKRDCAAVEAQAA